MSNSMKTKEKWWSFRDSNTGPTDYESGGLWRVWPVS